jgi:FkbM family methyltransferase
MHPARDERRRASRDRGVIEGGHLKESVKYLLRSRSLAFTRDHYRPFAPGALASYEWRGRTVWYRPGSSDTELIYKILLRRGLKGEYAIEPGVLHAIGEVRTVLDIGANIGVSAVYFAAAFPQARVFAFEPSPDNLAMLRRNTEPLGRVQTVPVALGEADGTLEFFASEAASNFGGFSRFAAGSDAARKTAVPMRHAARQLAELGVERADFIKIDVEGSEWEILSTLGEDFLSRAKYITGELHGHRDFDLLALLDRHFHVAIRKRLRDRVFMFQALSRSRT